MEITGTEEHGGVLEEQFVLEHEGRSIPGTLWRSEAPRGPIVLMGHGGSASTAEGYMVALGRHLVRDFGITALAIEGPVHGRRRNGRSSEGPLVLMDFMQAWSSDPAMTDDMVAEWRAALAAVSARHDLDDAPVGYWGLSMGTIIGLPLVAAEPRIAAAALGLCGATGPTADRLIADAPKVEVPVLFLMKWDDELFSRESVLELFGLLGSSDKHLDATPGAHGDVWPETFVRTAAFLAGRLAGTASPDSPA